MENCVNCGAPVMGSRCGFCGTLHTGAYLVSQNPCPNCFAELECDTLYGDGMQIVKIWQCFNCGWSKTDGYMVL